jgi:hypothetical protein
MKKLDLAAWIGGIATASGTEDRRFKPLQGVSLSGINFAKQVFL